MTVNIIEYWAKKKISIKEIGYDYLMGSSCHELTKKYHSSESRILEVVSYLGIKRDKSESVKKQVARENPGLINFLHTPDYVLSNLASLGISKKQLAYVFGMAGSGKAYKDKISSSKYDSILSHNKKKDIDYKYTYLRTVSKKLWYTLSQCNINRSKIASYLKVSESFVTKVYNELGLKISSDTKGCNSFVRQNFPDNSVLGTWVYQAYSNADILAYLINSFPDTSYLDFSKFFNNSLASCRHVFRLHNLALSNGDRVGSTYEEKVYKVLKDNYSGNIIRYDRTTLDGLELDFYLPEANFAIEVSPSETHSSGGVTQLKKVKSSYHADKKNLALSKGIDLLTLWDENLSDSYISNILPTVIKQHTSSNYYHYAGKLKYSVCSREHYDSLPLSETLGSNISDIIEIKDELGTTLAVATLGKYSTLPLIKAIKIIEIGSSLVLSLDTPIMEVIKKYIYNKYSDLTKIYASTGKSSGTGVFYQHNGFSFVRDIGSRYYMYLSKMKGTQPLSENAINKKGVAYYYNNGYLKVYDCGRQLYKLE